MALNGNSVVDTFTERVFSELAMLLLACILPTCVTKVSIITTGVYRGIRHLNAECGLVTFAGAG